MIASYSFCIAFVQSSHVASYIKEVGSKLADKFKSQSNEISMSSPELYASPPTTSILEFLIHVFLTSSGWTLSSVFMVHFGIFFDGPG